MAKFLYHLTENGAFMPNNFLSNFELSRLEIDEYGSIWNMNTQKQNMIIAFFLLSKILVGKILLQPDLYAGIRTDMSSNNLKKNLKILATFIQEIVRDYFMAKIPKEKTGKFKSKRSSKLKNSSILERVKTTCLSDDFIFST